MSNDVTMATRLRTLEARMARVEDELSVNRRRRFLTNQQREIFTLGFVGCLITWSLFGDLKRKIKK